MNSNTISCPICNATQTKNGKAFTPQTLGLHKKTCKPVIIPQGEEDLISCPYCSADLPESKFDAHHKECERKATEDEDVEEVDEDESETSEDEAETSEDEEEVKKDSSEEESEAAEEESEAAEEEEEPKTVAVDQKMIVPVSMEVQEWSEETCQETNEIVSETFTIEAVVEVPITLAETEAVEEEKNELEVSFTLSQATEVATESLITCNRCNQHVDDITNAHIVCHGCRVGAPT